MRVRNICMSKVYTCKKYKHVRKICMSEKFAYQKCIFMYFQKYMMAKSGLQIFFVSEV